MFPSSTTILHAYPQSEHLTKWIAEKGWNESQRIKSEAGIRGTRIHAACDLLEDGAELRKDDYSLEEWFKISTFVRWYSIYQPEVVAKEFSVFSPQGKYAGRLDRIYKIGGEMTILDFKSSSSIHDHFPLQFSSYAKAIEETTQFAIVQTAALQLGAKNKDGYRFVIYPDWKSHYAVFEHVRGVWDYGLAPKEVPVLELPDALSLKSVNSINPGEGTYVRKNKNNRKARESSE